MEPFFGRNDELLKLEKAYISQKSKLVAVYGRRRIGKSALIAKFLETKNNFLLFEGIENLDSNDQIEHQKSCLAEQIKDPFVRKMNLSSWNEFLFFLTEKYLKNKKQEQKIIIFLDEIQWMSTGRTKLISLIKYFWDNHWKKENIMLILCGSIASFMVQKVLKSKALYGRINHEILLDALTPLECTCFFKKKRAVEEQLKYMLVFGGVPKYLEEIDLNQSFNQNINRMCFTKNGILVNEIDKIFYSQFREARTYQKIVNLLKNKIYSLQDISNKLKIPSGGSLASYLKNLENAEIIRHHIPIGRKHTSKFKRYSLADEFIRFYFKFMEPNLESIHTNRSSKLFENASRTQLDTWLGFAFEKFCLKNSYYIASVMGFADQLLLAAPYFEKNDTGFQIDLIFKRADHVMTLCEIKYYNRAIRTDVIPEVQKKCDLLAMPKGYTLERALISIHGADKSLKDSEYFHHDISLKQLLG